MTNSECNTLFLASLTEQAKDAILASIARHYDITKEKAYAEVTHEEAEHLLDHMVEPAREVAHALMQRLGFS